MGNRTRAHGHESNPLKSTCQVQWKSNLALPQGSLLRGAKKNTAVNSNVFKQVTHHNWQLCLPDVCSWCSDQRGTSLFQTGPTFFHFYIRSSSSPTKVCKYISKKEEKVKMFFQCCGSGSESGSVRILLSSKNSKKKPWFLRYCIETFFTFYLWKKWCKCTFKK